MRSIKRMQNLARSERSEIEFISPAFQFPGRCIYCSAWTNDGVRAVGRKSWLRCCSDCRELICETSPQPPAAPMRRSRKK